MTKRAKPKTPAPVPLDIGDPGVFGAELRLRAEHVKAALDEMDEKILTALAASKAEILRLQEAIEVERARGVAEIEALQARVDNLMLVDSATQKTLAFLDEPMPEKLPQVDNVLSLNTG